MQHRLNMARAAGSTSFEKMAYEEIYRFSGGVPRLINIIAERTLLAAYLGESRKIKRIHVLEGRQSLSGRFPSTRRRLSLWFSRRWQRVPLAVLLLVIGGTVLLAAAAQKTLRLYVQRQTMQETFAPANYSQQFIRATIPTPEPVAKANLTRSERRDVTPEQSADRTASLLQPVDGDKRQALSAPEAGDGESESREKKEKFPQYLLKAPYVYTVQVESFKDEDVAAARMRELQSRGFDAWVAWIDLGEMGIWYRVLVGKYKDKVEAQAMADQLSRSNEFQRARQIATHKESAGDGRR